MRLGLFAAGTAVLLLAPFGMSPVSAAEITAEPEVVVAPRPHRTYEHTVRSCECGENWGYRHYWQWGWHRPWALPVVPPGERYWWSLDPPRVPADIWARKWHPPDVYHWARHHAHWGHVLVVHDK